MNPEYPIYIISKGRAKRNLTSRALNCMGVPHYIVVEAEELKEYKEHCKADFLVLPQSYIDEYDTCDNSTSGSKGSGPARNFCFDHSSKAHKKHWLMDDNLEAFNYLNRNNKHVVLTGSIFKAAEDFVARYSNVPLSGFNYYSFCKTTESIAPYQLNTRIYSCMLIDNSFGFKWRAKYNEDVDYSLRVLKAGYCTILFNAFLCGKVTTQRMRGGNTDTIYKQGTLDKSKMIEALHPDVASVVWRFNRWHHQVDYSKFKSNKLIKTGHPVKAGVNNYGLKLVRVPDDAPHNILFAKESLT